MEMDQQQADSFDLNYQDRVVALTIAGSDSGGGAGVQADLKTFSFYGVHGVSAITSLTAQNSTGVQAIRDVDTEFVKNQIRSSAEDYQIRAVKTGMLSSSSIIEAVSETLQEHNLSNVVVDPVMVAQSGDPLLKDKAKKTLIEQMLPLANVITPNIHEAEVILREDISELVEMEDAAASLSKEYDAAVVLKGGHLEGEAVDVLAYEGNIWKTEAPRINRDTRHGSGCAFSSAIAANMAMERSLNESVERAKNFITEAIRWGAPVGEEAGCVEPAWGKFRAMEMNKVQRALSSAVQELRHMNFGEFIPEVQSNFAYTFDGALFLQDVVGFPGRIIKFEDGFRVLDQPTAGATEHMGRLVLSAIQLGTDVRSALNIRYDEDVVRAARAGGLEVFEHNRDSEPVEIRDEEGQSIPFAVEQTYEKNEGRLPDVIFDRGAIGKEAMVRVLGTDPAEVVKKVRLISRNYDDAE